MKPGTFTQLYIHIVFAVKYRECLLRKEQRQEIYKYLAGTIKHKACKSIIVNGYTDHVHILTGLNPAVTVSDLVRDLKRSSAFYINSEKQWFPGKFAWQEGYGAFSYSKSQLDNVYNYILNQESHHGKRTFREEYLDLLKKFEIEYDEKYLFDFFE